MVEEKTYTAEQWQDLVRLLLFLLGDKPAQELDAVYLHGLSEGMIANWELFEHAVYQAGILIPIAFNGSDGEGMGYRNYPGAAWPGADWYIREFLKLEVNPKQLIPAGPGLHTRGETDALIELCKKREWKQVGVLTVPYHYPRVFCCLVKGMQEAEYYPAIYAIPPTAPPKNWWQIMLGSQGKEFALPFNEIAKEIGNFFGYQEKAYSASSADLFHYLQHREEIMEQQKFFVA